MPLDTRYIPAFTIQEVLVDKDTAFPLAGGKVYFYEDKARTILKPVWQISGTPPNYTYTVLPNPMILSSVGTFQDNSGNDIVPYFYPFTSAGLVDLYFIEVYSSDDVFQFSREGVPNTTETGEIDISQLNNFVPNGQFLLHNNVFPPYSQAVNVISETVTEIAQGGWTFERSTNTGTDSVYFPRFGSYVTNPTESPRYACNIVCTIPNVGDTYKGLRLKFMDVNKFASDTQNFTLFFSAINNSGGNQAITINVIKYFGSGGSATTKTNVTTLNVTGSYTNFNVPIIFGSNVGKTIGSNNDDYVQIDIGFPTSIAFNLSVTDFSLNRGKIPLQQFPPITNSQFIERSMAGFIPIPDPNGMDNGLPIRAVPGGFEFDDSMIGKFIYSASRSPGYGELSCLGNVLNTLAVSVQGIPYLRLWTKWYQGGNDSVAPGLLATGNGPFARGTNWTTNTGTITNVVNGAVTSVTDHGTGFNFVQTIGSPSTPSHFTFQPPSASSIPAGSYFTFYIPNDFGYGTNFQVWYRVDGVGSAPSSGNFGIMVDISSSDSDINVVYNTIYAIHSQFYAIPNLSGYFIRIWDNGAGVDPDSASRLARGDDNTGDNILTLQASAFKTHTHAVSGGGTDHADPSSKYDPGAGTSSLLGQTTTSAGTSTETRPINIYMTVFVKY